MPDWIKFVEVDLRDGRKTKVWAIMTIDGSQCLGRIGWYAPWRRYSFIPAESDGKSLIFEEDCLQRITEFLKSENQKHKQEKKQERTAIA